MSKGHSDDERNFSTFVGPIMRNRRHLEYIRGLPCAIQKHGLGFSEPDCAGPIHAHHPTNRRGMAQKSSDLRTFPLCEKHHHDFHNALGMFRDWDKVKRRDWQVRMGDMYEPKDHQPMKDPRS